MSHYIRMKDSRFFLRVRNGEAETTEVLSGAMAFSFLGGQRKCEELLALGFRCHLTNQFGEKVWPESSKESKVPSTAEQFTALPSAQRERLLQLHPREVNALFAAAAAAEQAPPKPEPPKPKRTITKCAIRGHRHIVGECPMIEVEINE